MSNDLKVAGEVHSENTGNANMIPIAYGTINSDGTIFKSSGNISVSKSTGLYSITITGENFFYENYITNATLIASNGFIHTSSGGKKLLIYTYDTSNVQTDKRFSFVVYKP